MGVEGWSQSSATEDFMCVGLLEVLHVIYLVLIECILLLPSLQGL